MNNEQKITTNNLSRATLGIKVPNKDLEKLKTHFPHCFDKDGKFDIVKFQQQLNTQNIELTFEKESYGLDWLGKSYARLLASDPATTLLKADEIHNSKTENANSGNLLIKGDNLEVLKHLANAYYEKVKMIYIDPPYNTGNDGFVYNDDRKYTVKELQNLIGIDEEKAKRILEFTQSKSNSHSAWLTFMYPRLYIAKQLLREDGVIFVSIDDNEVAQLRLLMDEVFGEENFIGTLSVENNPKGRKNSDFISVSSEYLHIYAKNKPHTSFIENIPKNVKDMEEDEEGNFIHNSGKRVLVGENSFNKFVTDERSEKNYSVYYREEDKSLKILKEKFGEENLELIREGFKKYYSYNGQKLVENTYTAEKFQNLFKAGALYFTENKIFEKNFNDKIRIKSQLSNRKYDAIVNGIKQNYSLELTTTGAGTLLKKLFGTTELYFDAPKNVGYLKLLITLFSDNDFTIIDFFAGSGTTGDAVMQLNAEDGGNRKYILVQLPEPIDSKKNKAAYDFVKDELKAEPTIYEITKERLLRAAKKIKTETIEKKIADKQKEIKEFESKLDLENKKEKINQLKAEIKALEQQDLGFKVFETMPIWEDYDFEADQFDSSQTLFDTSKLSEDDLKALLITWKTFDGIPLTQDLESVDLSGYTAYYGNSRLYLISKGFTTDNLKALLEKIDTDKHFEPKSIIAFGYHLESKSLREISENVKTYNNKKKSDIDFIIRY